MEFIIKEATPPPSGAPAGGPGVPGAPGAPGLGAPGGPPGLGGPPGGGMPPMGGGAPPMGGGMPPMPSGPGGAPGAPQGAPPSPMELSPTDPFKVMEKIMQGKKVNEPKEKKAPPQTPPQPQQAPQQPAGAAPQQPEATPQQPVAPQEQYKSNFKVWVENRLQEAAIPVKDGRPVCPDCGGPLYKRKSKFGEFYGCGKYPNCKGTASTLQYDKAIEDAKNPQPQQSTQPVQNYKTQQQAAPEQGKPIVNWIYAQATKDSDHFKNGQDLALIELPNKSWHYKVLTSDAAESKAGVLSKEEVASGLIKGYRGKDGSRLTSDNPSLQDLNQKLGRVEKVQDVLPQGQKDESGRPSPQDVKIKPERMTEYNIAIEKKFIDSDQGIMMNALAGTGKTTMLKHLSSFIKPGERWLYLVFNKKNQVESSTAFPSGIDVLTTHAFLGQLLKKSGKRVGGETSLPPMEAKWKKIDKILDQMIKPSWPESVKNYRNKDGVEQSPFNYKAKSVIIRMASLAKNTAHNPNDPKIKEQLKSMIAKFAIDTDLSSEKNNQDRDYTPDMIEKTIELLRYTMPGGLPRYLDSQELANVRDQDDTLWYAAIHADDMNWHTNYKVVLMDEVQDFNKCQLIMAKKLKETGARVIGVGDPHQSMYLFRGSDASAFDELKTIIGDPKPSELPINFRSGGNIIDWVNKNTVVNNMKAAPHQIGKGEVYAAGGTHPPRGYEDFMTNVNDEWHGNSRLLKEETCIVSRTNAPLAHAALQLLKNNIDFEIVGKDLSRDLIKHIKKVTWNRPEKLDIDELPNKLGDYYTQLQNKWGNKISKRDELKEIQEFTDTLIAVLQYLHEKEYKETPESRPMETAQDFMNFIIKKMGGRDPDSIEDMKKLKQKNPLSYVTLTTAHKCKGLEWDRVFLMKPKEYNPESSKNRTEEQKTQEKNCFYVSCTRAKKSLYVSADDKP